MTIVIKEYLCENYDDSCSILDIGCGHGFYCYEQSIVLCSQTGISGIQKEENVHWRDPLLKINWPEADNYILSPKDEQAPCVMNTYKSETQTSSTQS